MALDPARSEIFD
jgi:hypothetical protein